jgi:plasmid stability protein
MEEGMAVLNIKNFPDALARQIRARARRERRSMSQEVVQLLASAVQQPDQSILDLRGLGKEAWNHRDAAAHVASERESWD